MVVTLVEPLLFNSPTSERPVAVYACECGYVCIVTDDWTERNKHNDSLGSDHFMLPQSHPTLRIECLTPLCEDDGCDLSDCIINVNNTGSCGTCGEPARLYSEPLVGGVTQ